VVRGAEKLRDAALRQLAGPAEASEGEEEAVVVANAGLSARPLSVLLPEGVEDVSGVADAAGKSLPFQGLEGGGTLVHDPGREVPGLGRTTLRLRRGKPGPNPGTAGPRVHAEERGGGALLENELLRVEVGADGTLHRVYDKELGREALIDRGNQLWAYTDKPREWDAWDVDEDHELEGEEVTADGDGISAVEGGPLRAAVRVTRRWRDSEVEQTYRLHAGSRRLEVGTGISWHERPVLLRALFPLNVHARSATFETMYGAQERPTHRNTTWDSTRFEVSAHRWADLFEPGYGVALLNDGKYGHSAKGNVLGLSLVRSPLYPDLLADRGDHRFTYALYPHPGDWTEGGVVEEAFALNSPLVAVSAPTSGGAPLSGLVAAEGLPLVLGSLKAAEDGNGVVLRLHEPHGARGEATLRFARPVQSVERVNLLEEPEGEPVAVEGDAVRLSARPFEVVTLRVVLG
jgi:alpha-mannosidase